MLQLFVADFDPKRPYGVSQYANQVLHHALKICDGISSENQKELEKMTTNLKTSYEYQVEKACEGLLKQLEEKNQEIENLQKSQEVEKKSQVAQVQDSITEDPMLMKKLKEKDDENTQLRDRLKAMEQKLSKKLSLEKDINTNLHDSLQAAKKKLHVKEAENADLRGVIKELHLRISRQLQLSNFEPIEQHKMKFEMKEDELVSMREKLRVLERECQDHDNTKVLYLNTFKRQDWELDEEKKKTREKEDELENANGMLKEFQKWKKDLSSRLSSNEAEQLAQFTQVELAEQVVILDELVKKLTEELDFEKEDKRMFKELLKDKALEMEKKNNDKKALEIRLEFWARQAMMDEKRKAMSQKAAATQTEPASMGQWDRRSGVFANGGGQGLGQEKAENNQKTCNDIW